MKNIYKFIASEFFLALYFALPISTLFFIAKGIPFFQIMLLESFLVVAMLLFEIPTGIFGDKFGRKWSIAAGTFLFIVSWIPWLLADNNFWLYALSEFITGIALTFYSGSEEALMYDELKYIGKENQMQKYYGLYVGIRKVGVGLASLLGGYLAIKHDMPSFYLLFKLSIVAEIISLLIILTIKESPRTRFGNEKAQQPQKAMVFLKNGLTLLKNNKKLQRIALLMIFSTPFAMILTWGYQLYFQDAHVSNAWFGVAAGIASGISVFTSIFAHKLEKWFGVDRSMLLITLIPPVLWILMGLIFHPIIAIILMIANWSITNFREPIFTDYQNRHIESYNRATVLSTISLFGNVYALIMRPLFGFLIGYNLALGFILLGIVILIGSLLFRVKTEHTQTSEQIFVS
ncbi:MAG: MFS transporter [bacterium]|nr:MFS transporter [bacterium]